MLSRISTDTQCAGVVIKDGAQIRANPSIYSSVLTVIHSGDEVKINLKKSSLLWYHVSVGYGIEGYCRKRDIAVT